MKTLTEFASHTLKNAAKIRADLTAAGKTPEELPAAMGEALKLEGDRLTRMLAAIETVDGRPGDLKRVLVMQLNEGEKAPEGAVQKGDLWYVPENLAPITKGLPVEMRGGGRDDRGGRGGRDGRRGGPGGGRGGPGGGRGRDDRGGRGPGSGPKPQA